MIDNKDPTSPNLPAPDRNDSADVANRSVGEQASLLALGAIIDSRFRLVAELGRGGFGVVLKAHDLQLHRDVAIKIAHTPSDQDEATSETAHEVSPDRTESNESVRDALHEARLVARLRHSNIVRVIDVGSSSEIPFYIVSEFVEGSNLRKVTRGGRLPLTDVMQISTKIAEALEYAHGQGIVHLDVKPANILLDSDGEPHLTDFGMAINRARFPQALTIGGTPHYMSPELAAGRGHRINRQCDIYSLGVTIYYLVSGRLPYKSESTDELFKLIASSRYLPVGQLVEDVPPRLEHILDRAMAKRQSDRYQTAGDLATDLKSLAVELSRKGIDADSTSGVKVVPQGLRSFSQQDADFFYELLPGVRDAFGTPQSLRFWKHRLEQAHVEKGGEVCLVFGPSGCGKSSFVKAGLIPILSDRIVPIYVEASPENTERELLALLQHHADLPAYADNLVDAIRWLQSPAAASGAEASETRAARRFVIFIDQFEQWLHQRHLRTERGLAEALECCDGQSVLPVLMIRDDFWMAASRLMNELDIPIVEGGNAAAVDLFDLDHARRVLMLFGQANADLPPDASKLTADQGDFIRLAIDDLQNENRVVCVRIALFAQMMRGRDWSPDSLEQVGGSAGIGVRFLDETFSDRTGRANHRAIADNARLVLTALLPEHGTDIKGRRHSAEELRTIGQLDEREFQRLLQVLDKELRLITPIDDESEDSESSHSGGYQLTHDFLVPSIREWLFRKQQESAEGRAELCLAERASLWQSERLKRYLPSAWETVAILRRTDRTRWTAFQSSMMKSAIRRYSQRMLMTVAVVGLVMVGAALLRNRILADRFRIAAAAKVEGLLNARISDVPRLIEELEEYQSEAERPLLSRFRSPRNANEKLPAGLALASSDFAEPEFLADELLNGNPAQVRVIRQIADENNLNLAPHLWPFVHGNVPASQRLAAASGLALFSPNDTRWHNATGNIADALVRENALAVSDWMELLRPRARQLSPPLAAVFRNESGEYSSAQRDVAVGLLAEYAEDDTALLFDLFIDAPEFSPLLFRTLSREPDRARRLVKSQIACLQPEQLTGESKQAEALRRANLVVLAMKLDLHDSIQSAWQDSVDNSLRTEVIHSLAESSVDPKVLVQQTQSENDSGARAALVLGIGELVRDITEPQTAQLAELSLRWFEQDPAAGVHGACRWLILNRLVSNDSPLSEPQKTDVKNRFDQIESRLATGKRIGDRNWYITQHGRHSLAIVPGPTVGWVGSTKDTASGRDPDELRRKRKIGRTFAIGQLEVTVTQFLEFWKQRPKLREYYNVPAGYFGPVDSQFAVERVNWFLAADFCNWLSEQEGIPKDQWCFPEDVDRVDGVTIPDDYFERTGYRLLSETEWELAARNGSLTAWHFGSDGRRLSDFAWWLENADERIHPVGLLRPNGLGLFDIYGNAMEWMVSGRQLDENLVDDILVHRHVNPLGSRILRGGGYSDFRGYVRSAYRESYTPDAGGIELGIRIGRTMPVSSGE